MEGAEAEGEEVERSEVDQSEEVARPELGSMPLEVLEKILSFLSPEEACGPGRLVSRRFGAAAFNIIRSEFLALHPLIRGQLELARAELNRIIVTMDTFQQEMMLVARFTFLQVLDSEYQILSTIFFQNDSISQSAIIFKAVRNIKEFYELLENTTLHELNWRSNISAVIDNLRRLNSAVCDDYFWNKWNISKNPFGPLFIKLMCCSICSSYQISVCHESSPKFRNSKCHLHGTQEIPDLSFTLSPLLGGSRNVERSTRLLALYLCDSIRWSNVFHTLRLRWTCMDRALALGRMSMPRWPLLSPTESYLNAERQVIEETETTLRHNTKRLCRVLKKEGEKMNSDQWLGIRSDFRLWCPLSVVPEEMFMQGEHTEYLRLPEGVDTFRPYLFKLMLKINVKARHIQNIEGIEETEIWFEETPEHFIFTQSKRLIN